MFKDDYRKELNNISASEKFKQDTISLMQEKQAVLELNNRKEIHFKPKQTARIAASVAVLVLSLCAYVFLQSDFAISADNAAAEKAPQEPSAKNESIQKTDNYDSLPYDAAGNKEKSRIYTINDAVSITDIPQEEKKKIKVVFNTEFPGGMGFEGLMYYDISQMNTKNPFDENSVYDTLPVYTFSSMSNQDIEAEFNRILDFSGMSEQDILSVSYEWVEFGWPDGRKVIMDTVRTDTADKPTDTAQLYNLDIELTDGNITIWPQRSQIDISLYDNNVPTDESYGDYIADKAGCLLDTPRDSFAYGDYDYNGNRMDIPYYVFGTGGSYAEKAFNHSAGSIPVWYSEEEQLLKLQYNAACAYNEATELSAISWQQAIDMLYNGNYLSTVYEPVTADTAVAKIELVYKAPPYYPPADYISGYALPFYKFYVELPSFSHSTDKGTLKTYGVYYVCAIHPDYVEYTDGYIKFN